MLLSKQGECVIPAPDSNFSSPLPFLREITSLWPLLLGIGMMQLGNGLQGVLLGMRAALEGFATPDIGLMMSSYFLGFLVGSWATPFMVGRVGHIRVFGALASAASAVILVQAVYVNIPLWSVLRFISGFCFAGLFVVVESWLNNQASNAVRGKVFSVYMVVQMTGAMVGQLMLNVADPRSMKLFLTVSVIISLSLIPILLTAISGPAFDRPQPFGIRRLINASPLGSLGVFLIGVSNSALFSLGPAFGATSGMSAADISYFLSAVLAGAIILQWPVGLLSDRFDRRIIIILAAALACTAGFLTLKALSVSTSMFILVISVYGGLAVPLYGLCVSQVNDHLRPEEMVGASSGLIILSGFGSVIGPQIGSRMMDLFNPSALLWLTASVPGTIAVFGLLRTFTSAPAPMETKTNYRPISMRASPVAVTIITETSEHEDPNISS